MTFDNEMVELIFADLEEKTNKAVNALKNEYISIKAGRANQHVLDKILVDYYGSPTPINQMGNIAITDARCLMISVWDIKALPLVEKAILTANIGLTPNNDGKCIRLIFPELTEERRKEIAKDVKRLAENSKVAVRNERRKALDEIKKLEKSKEISEDSSANYEKEVEKIINSYIEKIDALSKDKEKEVLSV